MSELNVRDSYLDKIIAFGGNEFDGQPFQWSLEWGEHRALSAFSTLLADVPIIPPSYPETSIDDQYRPFQANDGMVPLTSALFLKSGSEEIFYGRGRAIELRPSRSRVSLSISGMYSHRG